MAIYSYQMGQIVSRSSGQSSVRAAAYLARECYEDQRTGWVHDPAKPAREASSHIARAGAHGEPEVSGSRQEVLFSGLYASEKAPDWCRGEQNIAEFWSRAEMAEKRRDAQIAERMIIAIPHELSVEQARWALQDHIRQFTRDGRVVQLAIHSPEPGHDERNLHAHLLVSLRGVNEQGFKATKALEQQDRYMNRSAYVEALRENWAAVANRHLARHGFEATLDHRSYLRQGIDREPQAHLGPGDARRERNGEHSAVIDFNAAVRERNAQREAVRETNVVMQPSFVGPTHEKAEPMSGLRDEHQVAIGRMSEEREAAKEAGHDTRDLDDRIAGLRSESRVISEEREARVDNMSFMDRLADATGWRRDEGLQQIDRQAAEVGKELRVAVGERLDGMSPQELWQEARADRQSDGRSYTADSLARELNPQYEQTARADDTLTRQIKETDRGMATAEFQYHQLGQQHDKQRQDMTSIGLLLHDLGIYKNPTLDRIEGMMENLRDMAADRYAERAELARDVAGIREQRAEMFAEMRPEVERELSDRQDRAREAVEHWREHQHERSREFEMER